MSRRSLSFRLLVLLLASAVAVSACSSDDEDASAPTAGDGTSSTAPVDTTTTTTETTTTVAPIDDADMIGEVGTSPPYEPEVLAAGWYSHELFDSFGFEVTEPVQAAFADSRSVLLRDPSWPGQQRTADVAFLELEGLVPPELVADESVRNVTGPAHPEEVLPVPVDPVAWADAISNVSITDEGTIDAPGTTVRWWDISVDAVGPTFRCAADTADCIGAVVTPLDSGVGVRPLDAQNLERMYLIDELPDVVGFVSARQGEFFDRGTAIMDMVVGSFRPTA